MHVVVVIPTYNERENIAPLLDRLTTAAKQIDHTFSYVVVDDTSPDGTSDVVKTYQKKRKDVFLLTGKKEGLGKALLHGLVYATDTLHADILLQLDADLSHDPSKIPEFIKGIDKGADFSVGCRYIPGGSIPENWGLHRKIFSVVGNTIVRFGLGFPHIHDWTGGFRAYKRKFFDEIKKDMSKYHGYVFQIAFLHKAVLLGAKVHEVPIHFTDRTYGRSKIAPSEYIRDVFTYVLQSRILWFKMHPFSKFLIVGSIGFIINTIGIEGLVALGAHPAIGSIVGAECAIISNFILNNAWTFKHKKISDSKRWLKFVQFNTASFGAVVIQATAVYVGTLLWGVGLYRLYYIVGVGIGLVWNYTMYSRVIWK